MKASGIVAIVPMKPLPLAKSRLAGRLSPSQRAALSLGMLRAVVEAALDSPIGEVWVVGGDEPVRHIAAGLGARWYEDEGADLNGSLALFIRQASDTGLAALYLPADLPFLTAEDVGGLAQASEGGKVLTLSPAHRDGGTNAILVPAGSPFRPALGLGSFQRHREQAAAIGIPLALCDRPGLGLDLDTPADLDACEEVEPGFLDRLLSMGEKRPVSG